MKGQKKYERSVESVGWCKEHRMVSFTTRKNARKAKKRMAGDNNSLSAFQCSVNDKLWHLGNLPRGIKSGERGRDTL